MAVHRFNFITLQRPHVTKSQRRVPILKFFNCWTVLYLRAS
jgi:hypothetical protein